MRAILERDFLCFASQRRYFVLRVGVVVVPLLLMMLLALVKRGGTRDEVGLALFFATAYSILLLTILITPAMLARVIAEERRDNKLDVLRSSPISAAGIVLGNWLSRVGLIATLIIAALPLNASALLFGGISPRGFLQSALVIFMTLLWVSSLALFVGATSKSVGNVVRRSYVVVLSLFVLEYAVLFDDWTRNFATCVNPLFLLATMADSSRPGSLLGMGPVTIYVIGSLLTTACLLGASIRGLISEPGSRTLTETSGLMAWRGGRFSRHLPLLWRQPALWLEVQQGAASRRGVWRSFLPLLLVALLEQFYLVRLFYLRHNAGDNLYELHLPAILIYLLLATFVTATPGASAVHRDSEANTRDVLHSTPLSNRRLVVAKVAGALSAAKFWWLLAMGHAVLGFCLGDVHFLSVVACVVISVTLLVALAALSTLIGMKSATGTRANVTVLAMIVSHLVIYPILVTLTLRLAGLGPLAITGIFMGHHPGFMLTLPFIIFGDSLMVAGMFIWLPVLLSFAGYVILAHLLISRKLPRLYDQLREDRRQR